KPENELDTGILNHMEHHNHYGYFKGIGSAVELVLVSKILNVSNKNIGYLKQKYLLKQNFLARIKNDLKLEMFLMDEKFSIVNSTLSGFENLSGKQLLSLKKAEPEQLVDVDVNYNTYGFIVYTAMWDQSPFKIVIGTSKKDSQAALKNISVAFLGITGLGVLVLIVTILISTYLFLRPVRELIEGLKSFENNDSLVQIKVKNKTEIGLLISTFNEMSLKVYNARNDLQSKINELEQANLNLKEAQMQLVQSAKMTSLGQLVAGVAHELNNPIAFIYGNTSHLRDYSEKLFKIIELIEKNPENADKIKAEYEFEYIRQDLPRLIKSCQDGAQRTRDIVLGLRNFSRLEESQLKEIDLHESINMTLELLRGEIKNRIKIHQNFGVLPPVTCYASQINQVIMNILTNSVHAISGPGEIWISTSAVKSEKGENDQVRISIRDSGIGMSSETVQKIFEPFFTTKDVGQGTGLGLSISYGIIQNHGGHIEVKSEIDVGTEFIITIPVEQKKLR
ncbi:MAG: ATP-binding protein, partial [Pseudobdellovibrio sp.]